MSDEDVRKYRERLKKAAEPPVQVDEVDSCFPRTQERVGITLEDDPEGQCLTNPCYVTIIAETHSFRHHVSEHFIIKQGVYN